MKIYAIIYAFAYTMLVIVAIVLPFYSSDGITFIGNSLSELGAQQTPGNWIMNISFLLMSVSALILGSYCLKKQWIPISALYFFGICFAATGMFQLAGTNENIQYSMIQDTLHSLSSSLSGFAFVLLCISIFFKVYNRWQKAQTMFALLAAICLSVLQFQFPAYRGIFQRLMFFICFGWLFYALTTYNFEESVSLAKSKLKNYRQLKKHLSKNEK